MENLPRRKPRKRREEKEEDNGRGSGQVSFTRIDLVVSLLCLNDGVSSGVHSRERAAASHPARPSAEI